MRPISIFILFVTCFALSVSSTMLEKIFIHDRGQDSQQQLKKSGRFDDSDEYDYIKRAIEEFKETIPKYTGFYFLDLVFEVVKNVVVFFLTILAPPLDQADDMFRPSTSMESSVANDSPINLGVIDNNVA